MIAFTCANRHPERRVRVRANVIMPGLIDTPMAVDDARARVAGKSRAEVAAERDALGPAAPQDGDLGMSRTLRCFWHPTRRISLPALHCRSMAARLSTSIEPPSFYNCWRVMTWTPRKREELACARHSYCSPSPTSFQRIYLTHHCFGKKRVRSRSRLAFDMNILHVDAGRIRSRSIQSPSQSGASPLSGCYAFCDRASKSPAARDNARAASSAWCTTESAVPDAWDRIAPAGGRNCTS